MTNHDNTIEATAPLLEKIRADKTHYGRISAIFWSAVTSATVSAAAILSDNPYIIASTAAAIPSAIYAIGVVIPSMAGHPMTIVETAPNIDP